jgi:hypothetical protein
MKIFYKACFGKITKVEVVGDTEKFVKLANGRKEKKITDWQCYFETLEMAKEWVIDKATRELIVSQDRTERYKSALEKTCEYCNSLGD